MGRRLDWTTIDADTKLCVSYLVGGRSAIWAGEFMADVASRVRGRVQLTTDGHKAYLDAVEDAFGMDVDFATLQKIYGAPSADEQRRYSPAKCIGCEMKQVIGNPDPKGLFHELCRAPEPHHADEHAAVYAADECLSKKIENHAAAVALHFIHYNFARIHKTLRITPAMAAGLSDHVWSYEEIAALAV